MKRKWKPLLFGGLAALLLLAAVYFFACTNIGYMLTVSQRGFVEIEQNVFVDEAIEADSDALLLILHEAKERLSAFWGGIQSHPTIIITEDETKLRQLGWTGSPALTTTVVLSGAHSYVVISPDGFNVDVAAHELTHAELHERLYKGMLLPKRLIPLWFDEGLATQNDYREKYDLIEWLRVTKNGVLLPDFTTLETASGFYNPDDEIRQYNYIVSKYEVAEWIRQHGTEELLALVQEINAGGSFHVLYSAAPAAQEGRLP